MKEISILGCGWLGLPLAKSLLAKGFSVKGSTTSSGKIPILENAGIEAFQISLSAEGISGNTNIFLQNSECLIIDIPPKSKGTIADGFVSKIQNLIPFIERSAIPKIIFVSSTSVYSNTENGKQLLRAETLLQNHPHFKVTVVRFAGLIGEDRHSVHFLAGKENIENPEAPINLIHQTDCIGIIESILEQNIFGETFDAAAPFHPARKDFYTQKALELELPLPKFDESKPSVGKIISSDKLETVLGYVFQKPTL